MMPEALEGTIICLVPEVLEGTKQIVSFSLSILTSMW